jgi:hypothetical protein
MGKHAFGLLYTLGAQELVTFMVLEFQCVFLTCVIEIRRLLSSLVTGLEVVNYLGGTFLLLWGP